MVHVLDKNTMVDECVCSCYGIPCCYCFDCPCGFNRVNADGVTMSSFNDIPKGGPPSGAQMVR